MRQLSMAFRTTEFEKDFNQWKTDYFGNYCMTKCNRTCCDMQNVSLHVNGNELKMLYDKNILSGNLKLMGIKTINSKSAYSIESKCLCRKFDDRTRKCLIYDQRPTSCREYPFIVEKDALIIKSGCPLSKNDLEYKKLTEITSSYGKVIVKKPGK
jgi:Fe-S-cluster containining protein